MTVLDTESTAPSRSSTDWVDAQTPHAKIYVGPAHVVTDAQRLEIEAACERILRFEQTLLRERLAAPLVFVDPVFAAA